MVVLGEDKGCQVLSCLDVDTENTGNYYQSPALYRKIKTIAEETAGGEFFIERKRLFDHWRDTAGRNRKETINRFTRVIKNYYTEKDVEIVDFVIREGEKTKRIPVVIIKKPFFNKHQWGQNYKNHAIVTKLPFC